MWIVAYLYASGACVAFLACDLMLDGDDKRLLRFLAFILAWPVALPALILHGLFVAVMAEVRGRKV